MPNYYRHWTVVQVGPMLQVPCQARFRNRQGWWYFHQRSRAADGVERANDAWSAVSYQYRAMAHATMVVRARCLGLPWRVVRHTVRGDEVVSFHLTREDGELHKPFDTDQVVPALWAGKEVTNVTTKT
jgi:hypothetical protein